MIDRLEVERKIVEQYRRMATISERMLAAATADDWDRVCEAEKECARVIEELSTIGDLSPADPVLRRQKLELMQRVLADDAAIRLLTQPPLTAPWLKKLDTMLRSPDNAARLGRVYGSGSFQG